MHRLFNIIIFYHLIKFNNNYLLLLKQIVRVIIKPQQKDANLLTINKAPVCALSGACLFFQFGVLLIQVILMKTYTICGSMRFEKEMQKIALGLETKHSMNIIQCTYNVDCLSLSVTDIYMLEQMHCQKIDISDGIYVVDINGYIGQSVKNEIEYAQQNNKKIIYHSNFIKQRK